MTNIETWNNELVAPASSSPNKSTSEKPKYNQVVNNSSNSAVAEKAPADEKASAASVTGKAGQECGPLSPSVDLNLKIESCKKVWEQTSDSSKAKKPAESIATAVNSAVASKKQPLMSIQVKKSDSQMPLPSAGNDVSTNVASINRSTAGADRTTSTTATTTATQAATAPVLNPKNVCTVKPNVSAVKPVQQASSSISSSQTPTAVATSTSVPAVEQQVSPARSDANERSPMIVSPSIAANVAVSSSSSKFFLLLKSIKNVILDSDNCSSVNSFINFY